MCIWNMAADTFGFDDDYIIDVVYKNATVSRFLEAEKSMGVSACKGMGKTFLLKAKRMEMMQRNPSVLFLPKNQLVDTPAPMALAACQINFLSSYANWVSLWSFCISAYILSQEECKEQVCDIVAEMDPQIRDLFTKQNEGVYYVLSRILAVRDKKHLMKVIQSVGLAFAGLQRIKRPIVLFIDKLEEPFNRGYYKIAGSTNSAEGKYNSSIWAYAQLAFAEAVYSIYSGRHHIKIFYSIREEALSGAEMISVEYSKFRQDMIVSLAYTYADLQKLFAKYVVKEDDENLFEPQKKNEDPAYALCGIREIQHRSGTSESVWAYIARHSLGRPRDIMEMCSAIFMNITKSTSNLDEAQRIRQCRHWINQISTRLCREYLHVLEPFMGFDDNIQFIQEIEQFLAILPTNVYTPESMKAYCHRKNGRKDKYECLDCKMTHFFSTLYNIGLLGYIYESRSENGLKNRINHIGDSVFSMTAQTLPKAVLYYVHPGLSNMIKELRDRAMQSYYPGNIIINSEEVFVNQEQVLKSKHLTRALLGNKFDKKVFITSTHHDLKMVRDRIKQLLENNGYEVVMYENPNFPEMPLDMKGKAATHDHCIDEALMCKHIIYIYGGQFGGRYAGERYQTYISENPVFEIQPSISFMEYYISKYYLKDVKVFVMKEIETARGEYIANGRKKGHRSKIVDNTDVFEQLGYFNALGNGTWYSTFSTEEDLEKYIKAAFPLI